MKTILTMTIPSHPCIVRVRHRKAPLVFNVSFMRDTLGCFMCVKAFHDGGKVPRRGAHMLLDETVRNWIAELQPIEQ